MKTNVIFYVFILIIVGVGYANTNNLHASYEAEVEECIAEGGGYECF